MSRFTNPGFIEAAEAPLTAGERSAVLARIAAAVSAWPAGAPEIAVHDLAGQVLDALTPAQRAAVLAKQPRRGFGVLVRRLLRESGQDVGE